MKHLNYYSYLLILCSSVLLSAGVDTTFAEGRGSKQLNILMPLDRTKIKDSSGESLSEKMKRVSQAYLELRVDEALKIADEALDLLAEQWPYEKMQADVQELFTLKILAQDSVPVSDSLLTFADQNSFVTGLPIKFQAALSNSGSKAFEVSKELFGGSDDRVFAFANEVKWPLRLHTGQWLIHTLHGDEIKAYWVEAAADRSAPKLTKLWTRALLKPLLSSPTRNQPAAQTLSSKSLHLPDEFSTEIREDSGSSSIFKSPWFWIVAGSALGVGGYFAFHSGQTATTR